MKRFELILLSFIFSQGVIAYFLAHQAYAPSETLHNIDGNNEYIDVQGQLHLSRLHRRRLDDHMESENMIINRGPSFAETAARPVNSEIIGHVDLKQFMEAKSKTGNVSDSAALKQEPETGMY